MYSINGSSHVDVLALAPGLISHGNNNLPRQPHVIIQLRGYL